MGTLVAKMGPKARVSNDGWKEGEIKKVLERLCPKPIDTTEAESTNNRHGLDRENEKTLLRL